MERGSSWYRPATQSVHLDADEFAAAVPEPQAPHSVEPSAPAYFPSIHDVHLDCCCSGLIYPLGQAVQTTDATLFSGWYLPVPHVSQTVDKLVNSVPMVQVLHLALALYGNENKGIRKNKTKSTVLNHFANICVYLPCILFLIQTSSTRCTFCISFIKFFPSSTKFTLICFCYFKFLISTSTTFFTIRRYCFSGMTSW